MTGHPERTSRRDTLRRPCGPTGARATRRRSVIPSPSPARALLLRCTSPASRPCERSVPLTHPASVVPVETHSAPPRAPGQRVFARSRGFRQESSGLPRSSPGEEHPRPQSALAGALLRAPRGTDAAQMARRTGASALRDERRRPRQARPRRRVTTRTVNMHARATQGLLGRAHTRARRRARADRARRDDAPVSGHHLGRTREERHDDAPSPESALVDGPVEPVPPSSGRESGPAGNRPALSHRPVMSARWYAASGLGSSTTTIGTPTGQDLAPELARP